MHNKKCQEDFLNFEEIDQFLLNGLFCENSYNIRKYFNHTLYLLCHERKEIFLSFIVKKLLTNIPEAKDPSRKECNQYYILLCMLLEEGGAELQKSTNLDYEILMKKMVENIRTHYSSEQRSNPQNDKVLIGFLNLAQKILQISPDCQEKFKFLAIEIFSTCLFYIKSNINNVGDFNENSDSNKVDIDYVKCKSQDSRRAAYLIITTLIKNTENLKLLLQEGLLPLFETIPIPSSWGFMPAFDARCSWGYAGINNLGCICYMIAMLQQFFMCPTFRYSIMMANDHLEDNLIMKEKFGEIDDNVLHQFQKMFAFLTLSDRQDYNPVGFCFSFKDYMGQPVNVGVQQDAQEFLNQIFDKLENGLKNTPFKDILQGVYGGKTCVQFICNGCKKKKRKIEDFYNLSVEVKNLKNIYESFEKLIAEETISDYFCDNCQKKEDITKRFCLSKLPNVLILHLQRIVFNLDSLANEKINSRLEFPFEMALKEFTEEGLNSHIQAPVEEEVNKDENKNPAEEGKEENPSLGKKKSSIVNPAEPKKDENEEEFVFKQYPKEYYEYKLKGVVVHTGTAEFGHYYSYINIGNKQWLEFNDSFVKEFDAKNIENECFGGVSNESSDDSWGWYIKFINIFSYLLL